MLKKLSIQDLPVDGKKVLMRVDFNVPLDENQTITDDSRLKAALPSIRHVIEKGGSVILMSHLGRPKGKPSEKYSLKPCAKRLSELLDRPVLLAPDCVGEETEQLVANLKPKEILLLENVRFHEAETDPKKDPHFAEKLAQNGDVYINDAFGTAHRPHASTYEIAKYFPESSAAGFLIEKEIQFLGEALEHPKRPFVALIGGAKVSSKLGVLKALLEKADTLLVGGGMAYTFLKAKGVYIGASICEDDLVDQAREMLSQYPDKLVLPLDIVVTNQANSQIIEVSDGIPEGFEGVDIGPKTIERFSLVLEQAKTVLWNGPFGVFELKPFAKGTEAIARKLAAISALTIVGGGDSLAAINQANLGNKMTHLSTGGGACLEYIEKGQLPGIEVLTDKK